MTRKPPSVRSDPPPARDSVVEERFEDLQAQFELLKAQVRQAQQLSCLGTAAATFAHEVNNLLTPILSYVRSAIESTDEKLRAKALAITLKNVEMLIAMSDRVLEINAAKPAVRQAVSVRDAVEAARESLCRDLAKDGITFANKVDDSAHIWADPLQIRQVLFNLFLNAREAMADRHEGRLTISATHPPQSGAGESKDPLFSPHPTVTDERVIVTVHNTGPPIPPEMLPHLFDPFQSSKAATDPKHKRCSGLGLALCRELIEENGGAITVTSDPHTGTTFTLDLPAPTPERVH